MSAYELAQLNIGIIKGPMDSPVMAEFAANLDRINAVAERSPGFVWRLQTIEVSAPRRYPEYHPEYYTIFFADPDSIRLEIVARTSTRRALEARWEELEEFLNPLQALLQKEIRNI